MTDEHQPITLTELQIDEIAERAAEKALEHVYTEIGKSVVRKALWFVGAIALAVAFWFKDHIFTGH